MLPFPGIPYGVAPAWCFPLIEGSLFLFFVLCFVHAIKNKKSGVVYLLGGLVFGVLLEYFEVAGGSYTYGHFHIMIGSAPHDLPLWVGAAWGVIMYTSRLFSDYLGLPLFAAASFDTLLALNIDVSIDVVAYRMHMWHWAWDDTQPALTTQWFGIPYGNFVGWATVIFCYSAFSRLYERWMTRRAPATTTKYGLIAAMAVLSSLAVLMFTESILFPLGNNLGITSAIRLIAIVVALVATVALAWPKRRTPVAPLPSVALWAPAWFHVFFVGCFFGFGFYRENPWMTAAAVINILIGIAIHLYPYRIQIRQKASSPANLLQEI